MLFFYFCIHNFSCAIVSDTTIYALSAWEQGLVNSTLRSSKIPFPAWALYFMPLPTGAREGRGFSSKLFLHRYQMLCVTGRNCLKCFFNHKGHKESTKDTNIKLCNRKLCELCEKSLWTLWLKKQYSSNLPAKAVSKSTRNLRFLSLILL